MFFKKLTIYIFCLFFSIKAYGASFTFPTTLTADTTGFVLVSNSGTTPAVSGFSTDVFVVVTGTAGKIKILTYAGLEQRTGYCGYTADNDSSEPADCAGDSIEATDGIGFEGSQAEVNVALATLSYKGDGSTSSVSITASATPTGASYNSTNGHYYKSVAVADIDWADARTAAKSEAQQYNGLTGYLATITTASENTFVVGKLATSAWIGGSDSGTEKIWKWMDGPEADTTFTCQEDSGGAGATISECTEQSYLNWVTGEPNQYEGNDEDCMHYYGTGGNAGKWNDYVCDNNAVDSYIIEYGGMGGTATVEATTSLTITSTESTAGFTIFDVELKTMIKAQIEASNRIVDASVEPVLNRINQPRKKTKKIKRIKKNKEKNQTDFNVVKFNLHLIQNEYPEVLEEWDIDFNKAYTYENYLKLFYKLDKRDNLYPLLSTLPITAYIYSDEVIVSESPTATEYTEIDNAWSTWTAGSITISERQFKIGSLGRKSDSDSITFGIDRAIGENAILGIAYREGEDNTDISNQGTKVKIKSQNITTYTSWRSSNNNSIDFILGAGHLTNDLTRKESSSATNTITGSRTGDQIYGILNFALRKSLNQLTTSYYSRIQEGYTKLYAYSENANDSAAHFKDQHIRTSIISIGTSMNYQMELQNGNIFNPNALFEFSSDESDSSKAVAYYLSDSSSVYTYQAKNDASELYKLGMGFDFDFADSWSVNSKMLRKIYKDSGHENTFMIEASLVF